MLCYAKCDMQGKTNPLTTDTAAHILFQSPVTYYRDIMAKKPQTDNNSPSTLGVITIKEKDLLELLSVDVDSGRQIKVEFSVPIRQLAFVQNFYGCLRIRLADGSGFYMQVLQNADEADDYAVSRAQGGIYYDPPAIPDSTRDGDLGWWLQTLVDKGAHLQPYKRPYGKIIIITLMGIGLIGLFIYLTA